jgi:regulatory protein
MKITRIKPQRRNSRRLSVFLDGSYAFSLNQKTCTRLGLEPGQELTDVDVERILRDEQLAEAKEYAALLLSYRARTTAEMHERLLKRGFDPAIADAAIGRLTELKLLDDERFACDFAADRVSIGHKGKFRVRGELIKRGVERKTIDRAIDAAPDEEPAARELVRRFRPRYAGLEPATRRQRLYALLARRGFGLDTIRSVLDIPDNGD